MIVERFSNFKAAIEEWRERKQDMETASAALELARRRVRVARERFWAEFRTTTNPEGSLKNTIPTIDWRQALSRHEYLGLSLAEAARIALSRAKKATTYQIAFDMEEGGFEFRTQAHAREVHAVLLKQPYVKREGEEWRYKEARAY